MSPFVASISASLASAASKPAANSSGVRGVAGGITFPLASTVPPIMIATLFASASASNWACVLPVSPTTLV